MHWEKKICFRLTTRRIVGAILTATTVVNLVIVGAVFEAAPSSVAPTLTPMLTTPPSTITLLAPASTDREIFTHTLATTNTPTQTSSTTPTDTLSPTDTQTIPPSSMPCAPWYSWPIYVVQRGDTLSALARATGSSSGELMLANCLPNDLIYAGQLLYVPRLPIKTLTPSSTSTDAPTPSSTVMPPPSPTDTQPSIPTNTPYTPTYTPPTPATPGPLYYYQGIQVLP